MILLALLLQTAPAAAAPPVPEKFSILVDPCASAHDQTGNDIVVCGSANAITPRLPMREWRGPPDHAVPSNPDMTARVALDGPNGRGECGAYGEGCPVGLGGYVVPALLNGAVGAVKGAFARKPDKRGRVAIPLDDEPAATAASSSITPAAAAPAPTTPAPTPDSR